MLSHNDIPDARVEKESRALLAVGHKVFLVVPNIHQESASKSFTKVITYNYNFKHYFYGLLIRETINFHLELIKKYNIDIIHAHNIICINIALLLAKKTGLKLIYDDHETWSLWMKLRVKAGLSYRKILRFVLYQRVKRIEKKAAKIANHIIVTNRKCIDFYNSTYSVDRQRISEIENIALEEEIEEALANESLVNSIFTTDPRKKIVHVYRHPPKKNQKQYLQDQLINRDFSRIIEAQEKLDDWVLILIGKKNVELEKRGVIFIDHMLRVEYLANIAKADVGLNPLVINEKTSISSQNRIFEYAKLGVRIISTQTELLKENFGDLIIWFNPDDSLEKIIDILKNIDKQPTAIELKKFSEKFNWEKEMKKILAVYTTIIHS